MSVAAYTFSPRVPRAYTPEDLDTSPPLMMFHAPDLQRTTPSAAATPLAVSTSEKEPPTYKSNPCTSSAFTCAEPPPAGETPSRSAPASCNVLHPVPDQKAILFPGTTEPATQGVTGKWPTT